jgi:hypothetical protein
MAPYRDEVSMHKNIICIPSEILPRLIVWCRSSVLGWISTWNQEKKTIPTNVEGR